MELMNDLFHQNNGTKPTERQNTGNRGTNIGERQREIF